MSIAYQAVSIGAILRDYEKPQYASEEHKRLVDIADSLYNINIPVSEWGDNPEFNYKDLYYSYDQEFWDLVLRDMGAIDSQISDHNIDDLREEYKELLHNIK